MLTKKDAETVFETLLSSPGMNDSVKMSVSLSRKNILLLTRLIEQGIGSRDSAVQGSIVGMVGEETIQSIGKLTSEMLAKAGLTELNEKLNSFK